MDLLNSDRHDYLGRRKGVDSLDDPRWLEGYLKRSGFEVPPAERSRLIPALRRLRRRLQDKADAVAQGTPVTAVHLEDLNEYLAAAPLVRRLDTQGGKARLRLEPVRRTAAAVLAGIVSSFAETLAAGGVGRIKLCGNKDCRWVFRDTSKSGTRKWCSPTCGNLMKVRRFRRKADR
jgi:predicted RNA-binding Zn ribbon-like protein